MQFNRVLSLFVPNTHSLLRSETRLMQKSLAILAALGAAVGSLSLHVQAQVVSAAAPVGSARVIVKLRADSTLLTEKSAAVEAQQASTAQALGKRIGVAMSAGSSVSERTQVVFASGITSVDLANRLAQEADVEYAVPDQRRHVRTAPNDPLYASGVAG